jgi:two-component system, NtrC family, response regulator AtoC
MKTILFADDNKSIREICKVEFEDEGYRVVLARDGVEAVHAMLQELPDVVILDIAMPRANGLDAIEQIKALDPRVPVIFYTAFDEDCIIDHRGQLAVACVEKVADLSELKRVVIRAMTACRSHVCFPSGLPPAANS